MSMSSQFQPASQIQMPAVPVVGQQTWLPSGSQGLPVATPMQPTGQLPAASPGPIPVCALLYFIYKQINGLIYLFFTLT